MRDLRKLLTAARSGDPAPDLESTVVSLGSAAWPALFEALGADGTIDEVERLEDLLKASLKTLFERGLSRAEAIELARLHAGLGFTIKLKSYAIKATTPLGYSVFLQEPGRGFSFQRHLKHKVELFHILEASPGSLVFVSDYGSWEEAYEPATFDEWLRGERPSEALDRLALRPRAGDVVRIAQTGIVHTVLGCTLQEFATVSTDMVERLHDQNAGAVVPSHYSRDYAELRLRSLYVGFARREEVGDGTGFRPREMEPAWKDGVGELRLGGGGFEATQRALAPGAAVEIDLDASESAVLHASAGTLELGLVAEPAAGTALGRGAEDALRLEPGDVTLCAPGFRWQLRSVGEAEAFVSEHRIPWRLALVPPSGRTA